MCIFSFMALLLAAVPASQWIGEGGEGSAIRVVAVLCLPTHSCQKQATDPQRFLSASTEYKRLSSLLSVLRTSFSFLLLAFALAFQVKLPMRPIAAVLI